MLLYFKVSNFRSIDKEVELSMLAAEYDDLKENTIPIENYGVSVVKTAMLYGANASGKSNLLKAISIGVSIILDSYKFSKEDNLPYFPNKNDLVNIVSLTHYVYGFFWNETHYEYSFSNTDERIWEEKLVSFTPDETINVLYQRQFDENTNDYNWYFDYQLEEKEEFLLAIITQKKLLLSVVFQLDKVAKEIEVLKEVCFFFTNLKTEGNVISVFIDFFKTLKNSVDEKAKILNLLQSVDLPITDLDIIERREPEGDIKYAFITYHDSIGEHYGVGHIPYNLMLDESSGTRRFVSLLAPLLKTIAENQILVIDELENSMHPMLAQYIIDYFHKHSEKAQLIFSSHDTSLMNLQKVRLDQIYVTNANAQRNTEIESLSNYEIDKDRILGNVYLQGILGGVPYIKRNF